MFKLTKKFFIILFAILLLLPFGFNKLQAANLLKTVKFYIFQATETIVSGTETSQDFTISIAEPAPEIRSAFIEIRGFAKSSVPGNRTLNVKVGSGAYTGYNIEVTTSPKKIFVTHDITALVAADFPAVPGTKNYTLYIQNLGFDLSNLSAKLILTYKYSESTGTLPISGYAISSTVDTEVAKGAAFNSLMWQGDSHDGKVRMQFASSNCPGGQTDYPACSSGTWQYYGPSCAGGDSDVYLMDQSDLSVEIMCPNLHNNKRYFRYKVILCSNDCVVAGSNNPEVTDVIVNWAP